MGPRAGLDRCEKYRPSPGFDSRTVQPVASRYTEYPTRSTKETGNGVTNTFVGNRPTVRTIMWIYSPVYIGNRRGRGKEEIEKAR